MKMRASLVALALFGVCAFLRVGLIDRHGLWADEFFSLAIASGHSLEHPAEEADPALGDYVELPFPVPAAAYARYLRHDDSPAGLSRVVRAVRLSDTNPPLYYLLLNLWTRSLGASDAILRLFSVAWALACFPLLWSLAGQVGGRSASLPACVLFTLSPASLFYSTEGRPYSMLLFFTICLMWLTIRLGSGQRNRMESISWVAVSAAGLLTHYFFLFVWGAAALWLFLHPGPLRRGRVMVLSLVTFVLVLPWYAGLPASLSGWRVTGYWQTMRPGNFHPIATPLALPWSFFSTSGIWGDPAPWDMVNAVLLALLAMFGLWRLRAILFDPRGQLLWLWLLLPCLGLVALDALRGTYTTAVPRYALSGLPAAFVLVGLILGRLTRTVRAMGLALIVVVHLIAIGLVYGMEARNFQDYRRVGTVLAEDVGPLDVVIVHSIPSGVTGVARYIEQTRSGAGHTRSVSLASWVGQLGQRRVPADLEALAGGRRRVILVETHAVGEPAPERDWLMENAVLVDEMKIHDTRLQYFAPADGGVFFVP